MSEDNNDLDKLRAGVLRQGFALEWQTSAVFIDKNWAVEQNKLYSVLHQDGSTIQNQAEIDVLAMNYSNSDGVFHTFVLECKGTSSKNFLVMIEAPENNQSFPTIEFSEGGVRFASRKNFRNDQIGGPFLCYTGDFFHRQKEAWDRVSKSDDRSNLFKGVQQVVFGVDAFFRSTRTDDSKEKHGFRINSGIVTNAQIVVTRFGKGKSLAEPEMRIVPWVMLKNSLEYGVNSDLGSTKWESDNANENKAIQSQKKLPFIWIINVNYLKRFLEGRANYDNSFLE